MDEPADEHGPGAEAVDLEAWGIEGGYRDGLGQWRTPSPSTVDQLRRAMGAQGDDPAEAPPAGMPLMVLRPDVPRPDLGPVDIRLEDGTIVEVDGNLPPDLPFGYHSATAKDSGQVTNVIVSPGRCALDEGLHAWGVTAQLYAARSGRSWGMGDLGDLRTIIDWATERGAAVVGLNPLHAPSPLERQPTSPYSPSSRRFHDPIYLAIENVPGARELSGMAGLVAAGRSLNAADRIDRSATWALKRAALEAIWLQRRERVIDTQIGSDGALERHDLHAWGTFCALVDHHGTGWRSWPTEHRQGDGAAVARFAAEHADRVRFWMWLQDLLEDQLVSSRSSEAAIADLAVGIDPDGFDAWQWQHLLADGVRIGAPPDPLGRDGQDWGLPPFVPWRLRDAAYAPFAATVRANLRHSRGLRIDHVMGLFRLLWVPPDGRAVDGAYVRFAGQELLDVLAIESQRTGGLVVGEDLGTVEAGVRETLRAAGVLSTRLLWFEDDAPETWPHQAMAAVTTHDLPTLAGVWSGVDLDDQVTAGFRIAEGADSDLRHRVRVAGGCDDSAPLDEVLVAVHRTLARSSSMIATATLDDLTGAEHRPNLPGTVDEHPNWRIPLPLPVDRLDGNPTAEAIATAMAITRAAP